MKEQHLLVDYENVQPTLEQLARMAPGFTDVWLFYGPHQVKPAQELAAAHDKVRLVLRSGKGKNALDFHLSFYLGYVAARHPQAHLVVVSNDAGYDPMIAHAKLLGFRVRRARFRAKKGAAAPKATLVTQPAAAPKMAAKKAPAETSVPADKSA